MTIEFIKLRNALYAYFLALGLITASWIVRTPSIRDALAASTFEMGLVLFGLSFGSMTGILQAAALVRRYGTRPVMVAGFCLAIGGVFLVSGGAYFSLSWMVAVGLASLGLAMAASEVGGNVEGAIVERGLSQPVLPILHGCFSLGTVIGALFGMLMATLRVPVTLHLSMMGLALVPLAAWTAMTLFKSQVATETDEDRHHGFFATMASDYKLVLIGVIVMGVALAEGAANDWLPLLMVDEHGMAEGLASFVFVGFAATMTVGRFLGPAVLRRYGSVNVIRFSAVTAIIGVAIVVFSDNVVVAGFAVLLWGIGASLGFPVVMSIAGGDGRNASARVGAVATVGYLAFLVGPPLLGLVGQHFGLRTTMMIVLLALLPCVVLSPALRSKT